MNRSWEIALISTQDRWERGTKNAVNGSWPDEAPRSTAGSPKEFRGLELYKEILEVVIDRTVDPRIQLAGKGVTPELFEKSAVAIEVNPGAAARDQRSMMIRPATPFPRR